MKPENILLNKIESNHVKLIDFGSAMFIDNNDVHYEMQTVPYRSPEITLKADYGFAIDMWSLGCIIYEIVTHRVLFDYNCPKKNLIKALSLNKTFDLSCFNIREKEFLWDK